MKWLQRIEETVSVNHILLLRRNIKTQHRPMYVQPWALQYQCIQYDENTKCIWWHQIQQKMKWQLAIDDANAFNVFRNSIVIFFHLFWSKNNQQNQSFFPRSRISVRLIFFIYFLSAVIICSKPHGFVIATTLLSLLWKKLPSDFFSIPATP